MHRRIALTAAIVGIALFGVVVPAAGAAQTGQIVVAKFIFLKFPSPGVYTGTLKLGKPKVKRNAASGRPAGPRVRQKARHMAGSFCKTVVRKFPVEVDHLSNPLFQIGEDLVDRRFKYRVEGEEPPTGDPVRARQLAGFDVIKVKRWRWRIKCRGDKTIKPYPY